MAIKVNCKCGHRFAVKDEMAGRAIKCPKCSKALTVPAPAAAKPKQTPAASQPAATEQPPSATKKSAARKRVQPKVELPGGPGGLDGLLQEVGLEATKGPKCPMCGAPVQPNAIICVECGFNRETGERIEQIIEAESSEGDPYAKEAEQLLKRASQELKASPETGQDFGEGLTAYIFTFGFIVATAIGLSLGALFLWFVNTVVFPPGEPQTFRGTVSFVCCTFGSVLIFLGWIDIVQRAFQEKLYLGIATMLVQPLALLYGIARSLDVTRALILILFGGNMVAIGALVHYSGSMDPYRGATMRWITFLLSLVFYDVRFMARARLIATIFAESNGLLHGCLSLFVPLYAYIRGFMGGKKTIVPSIVAIVASVLLLVTLILFLSNVHFLSTGVQEGEEALLQQPNSWFV